MLNNIKLTDSVRGDLLETNKDGTQPVTQTHNY